MQIFQAYRKRRSEIMAQSLEESVIQKQLRDLQVNNVQGQGCSLPEDSYVFSSYGVHDIRNSK